MRPYRGIPIDGKDFVYGSLLDFGTNSKFICTSKHGYSYCRNGSRSYIHIKDAYEVIPETVGQSTGLKDKSGVEIYKGDKIEGNLFDRRIPTMGEIVYDSEHACYGNKNDAGITPLFKIAEIEVIGNVHQNPELMEADND